MERGVGFFVLLATLLLLAGFCYYLYHTGQRKGWFDTKVVYFTLTETAAGLKVGDPVKLMGFDVGEITRIDAQPPDELFNVYVQFEIKAPYFGYLWTGGSHARVTAADFLGKRSVEVTKGTNYIPTHLVWDIREYTPREAQVLDDLDNKLYLDAISLPGTNPPLDTLLQPLAKDKKAALKKIAAAGIARIRVADRKIERKNITMVWDTASNAYKPFDKDTKPYWLPPVESPALTERLEALVNEIAAALPGVFDLTNQLTQVLTNAASLTAHADELLVQARPLMSNITQITANLRDPSGSLGQWLIPTNLNAGLLTTLSNADGTLTNASATLAAANTNLVLLIAQLNAPLQSLSSMVSNLNTQVGANTNFVTEISRLIVDLDGLIEGFKRHWLLRGAFKQKPTNAPPAKRKTVSRRN